MTSETGMLTPWFRIYRRAADPAVRLLCLPYAGGAASAFAAWPPLLPPDTELVAVQYPGRQDRIDEPCVDSVPRLADLITAQVYPLLDRPLAIFGHSMGASVGYEIACRLEERHGAVAHVLMVSAASPPHRRPGLPPLPDDAAVLNRVRQLGGFDCRVFDDPRLRELVLPAIRADFRAARDYSRPQARRLKAPVVAYAGDSDAETGVEQLRAWSEVTLSGFSWRTFPGGHFYLDAQAAALITDIVTRIRSAAR